MMGLRYRYLNAYMSIHQQCTRQTWIIAETHVVRVVLVDLADAALSRGNGDDRVLLVHLANLVAQDGVLAELRRHDHACALKQVGRVLRLGWVRVHELVGEGERLEVGVYGPVDAGG